jgi:tungstate transport system substrate-binding protein
LKRYPLALLATLFIAMFVLLGACGDDGDDGEPTRQPAGQATAAASPAPTKASGELILATTTSTQDSGLLDVLVPKFEDETGYSVKTIAVGSGQAIEQASRGDADVVLAHSPAAEEKMVEEGDGVERALIMHNDFVLVGPAADAARIKGAAAAADALSAIATAQAPFVSRGDDSGTHALEKKLWTAAAVEPAGAWYSESGQGMAATLQVANQQGAYTISDRATYLTLKDDLDLDVLFEKEASLLNYYHVIVVNPEKHPRVQVEAARAFAAFLVRDDIQKLIGEFGVAEHGEPLFVPDAGNPEPGA